MTKLFKFTLAVLTIFGTFALASAAETDEISIDPVRLVRSNWSQVEISTPVHNSSAIVEVRAKVSQTSHALACLTLIVNGKELPIPNDILDRISLPDLASLDIFGVSLEFSEPRWRSVVSMCFGSAGKSELADEHEYGCDTAASYVEVTFSSSEIKDVLIYDHEKGNEEEITLNR